MNLNIHLDGSNTILGSAHLKIHIAKKIFQALDVCKHQIIVIRIPGHKTAGNTSYHFLNRNAGSHQGKSGGADACLRGGTVGFHGLRYGTDCIWEFLRAWQNRNQCPLRQGAMAYLAAAGSSAWLCLAYREGWEVIVMHITLAGLILIQAV